MQMDKTNTPLVSIVIITYNSARYVLKTLESVKEQTWRNLELIISDDGSTDQTIEICLNWLSENKECFYNARLLTVAQNTGIPANCNRGLRATSGAWVKTISGDDILLDTCVADNMKYTTLFPEASFIVSDIIEIDEYGELIRDKVVNEGLLYFDSIPSAQKQLKAYVRWPVFLNTPTFFCRRELLGKVGFCDEEFKIYEDMTMVIRIMESNYRLFYLKKPTIAYRVHGKAISRSVKMKMIREKEALKVFQKYRRPHLNFLNPLDLSVYYENWLGLKYKGVIGIKGDSLLRKLSLHYLYMKSIGIKSY